LIKKLLLLTLIQRTVCVGYIVSPSSQDNVVRVLTLGRSDTADDILLTFASIDLFVANLNDVANVVHKLKNDRHKGEGSFSSDFLKTYFICHNFIRSLELNERMTIARAYTVIFENHVQRIFDYLRLNYLLMLFERNAFIANYIF
jgi:hypothetical protein